MSHSTIFSKARFAAILLSFLALAACSLKISGSHPYLSHRLGLDYGLSLSADAIE